MSEGGNSVSRICENSLTTLRDEVDPEKLPPRTISHTTRRPRFGLGNVPLSPYILIDGRKLRSSLALSRKKPPRRVSFPTNDNHLITGYLEPANPWKLAENVDRGDLITAYKESCIKHNSDPLETVISQLESLSTTELRNGELNLKGEMLDVNRAEPLEEVFKRIQFDKVDLQATFLDDESSVILFDMLEYYESVKHLNISSNQDIGIHGWQACANMIRKTQCLEHLEAKDVILNEQYMNILSRALRLVCHLHVLKLENCGLSGRSIVTLVAALKMNTGIRELYLADNGLNLYDAIQLGSLLRLNNHIQLLDISNNVIQDDGVRDILEGLINQINEDKDGKGLSILILWNNQLTKKSSPYFARIIALSKTLETLNIGKNTLTDELLFIIKDALKKNRVLLQLGIQSTEITCDGIVTLSEIIEMNQVLQRIDLRNNSIEVNGIKALSSAMKKNKSITKIDLDDKLDTKVDDSAESQQQYAHHLAEVRGNCSENEENRASEETSEGFNHSYRSRLCSTTSRKISLTCQTLPCTSPSVITSRKDDAVRSSTLEPKRVNGGRLRSPAPSPVSSPVASPILSPSRSRFVVSRVPETSHPTESSVTTSSSSSTIVPSSLGPSSSSTCVVSASGPSRFRVSVVESASTVSLAQPVVTSKDTLVQPVVVAVALKPIVCITESKDSGDLLTSELDVDDRGVESPQNSGTRLSLASCVVEEVPETTISECSSVERSNGDETSIDGTSRPLSDDETNLDGTEGKVDASSEQVVPTTRILDNDSPSKVTRDVGKVQMENNGSACTRMNDRSTIVSRDQDGTDKSATGCANESIELQTKHDPIQKGTSNLGRLLSLFQHSSCFFSDAASIGQLKSKGTGIQGSINSMMTLGDKFHYYIKDKKEKIYNRDVEESTVSLKGKSKFFNVSQLPSLQSLASIIPSFRFDSSLNVPEQSSKSFCSKQVNLLLENNDGDDPSEAVKKCGEGGRECENLNVYSEEENTDARAKNDPLLSKDTESTFPAGVTKKEVVLAANCIVSNIIDTCSKIVNDNLLMHASSGNTIVPVPKLLGIPEYSALRAARNDIRNRGTMAGILERVDPGPIKGTDNNKCLTDSINFTSDSSSLSRCVTCNAGNDTRTTVHTPDRMHNLVILNLSTKGNASSNSAFGVNNSARGGAACILRDGGCVCNVNNKPDDCYNSNNTLNVKTNCLNNEVTKMYSIDSDSDRNVFISVRKMPSIETEEETVDVNSSTKWNSMVLNNRTEAKMSNTCCACKDVGFEVRNGGSELCTPCRVVRAPTKQISMESSLAEGWNECFNNSVAKSCMENTSRNRNIVVSIPRMQYCTTNFNTFMLRNLVRHVADICIDGTPVERVSLEIAPYHWPRNVLKVRTLFYDVSQISDSLLNAVTEQPEEGDRQTEENVSSGDCIKEGNNWQRTEENDAPGIASGCSTLPVVHSRSDTNCSKGNPNADSSSVENIPGIRNSGSDTTRRTKCTNSDNINRRSDEYLNAMKCAVATTVCTTTTVANTRGNATVDVITEQNSNIAESSMVIHATSTK